MCVCSTPNKRTAFPCLQIAMAYIREAAPLSCPVPHLSLAARSKTIFVLTHASRLAAASMAKQVRVYEIYQSNNDVNVIVNQPIKIPKRKYGNYLHKERITAQNIR